ncbi:MAG: YciI family protein [Cyclobacteriaceae bacterium]
MKWVFMLFFGLTVSMVGTAQDTDITTDFIKKEISKGRSYVVAFLKEGPNRKELDSATVHTNQEAHLNHLFGLKNQGKLAIFGPFFAHDTLKGFCIFDTQDVAEVKSLLDADPHVQSGYLAYEILTWFGLPGDRLPE